MRGREDDGRVQRTAACQHVDDVEIVEGEDRGQKHVDHRRHRQDRGDDDVDELADASRAVDLGRLELLLVDVLQRGEKDHGREGKALPEGDEDDRAHGVDGFGEPGDRLVGDAEPQQEGIDEAELRVIHEAPQDGGHDAGQHPGQQDQRAQHALAGKVAG